MILMIDNYDSFTYNLVQYLGEMGHSLVVKRNDEVTARDIEQMKPDYLMISPGPCTPNEAGVSLEVVRHFSGRIPILGVCLGHQAIAQAHGANIVRAEKLMHGKTSDIHHDHRTVFQDMFSPLTAMRYHSLIVEKASLSPEFEISAWTEEGEIMGIRHKKWAVEGVQFHPESILTKYGKQLLANFLNHYRLSRS